MPLAVICRELGPPERLVIEEVPRRPLAPGELRVRHRAAGVNFPDILMCAGSYQHKPPLPFTPGFEAAGEVIEVAPDVTQFKVGDPTMLHFRTGGYAEESVVPVSAAMAMPPGLDFAEAATFLTANVTAYAALVQRGGLKAGEVLLVLGAAGGVGLAAVEMGKLLGATVIAVASTEQKRAVAKSRGADHVITAEPDELRPQLRDILGERGVDMVYDPVGGDLFEPALRALAWDGRYMIIGFASGTIPTFRANLALLKGARVMGVRAGEMARRDPSFYEPRIKQLYAWAAEGHLKPHIGHRFPLSEFRAAMNTVAGRQAIGRVVITMND